MRLIVATRCWTEHDADGMLPPVDVLVGVLARDAARLARWWADVAPEEALVLVPPQWIGDWESGHALAPGYQHIWRVPLVRLHPVPRDIPHGPYRPATLPASATGPRPSGRPAARRGTQ